MCLNLQEIRKVNPQVSFEMVCTFTPALCEKSREMVDNRSSRNRPIEEILLDSKVNALKKIEAAKEKVMAEEVKDCSFTPSMELTKDFNKTLSTVSSRHEMLYNLSREKREAPTGVCLLRGNFSGSV
jgi:hypothetical protein